VDLVYIRWAVHAAEQGRLEQLPGVSKAPIESGRLPEVGDRFTNPFLVDPATQQPVEVMVSEVLLHYSSEYIVVVVTRAQ